MCFFNIETYEIKENIVLGMMGSERLHWLINFKNKFKFFWYRWINWKIWTNENLKIFEIKGEKYFREIEEKICPKILRKKMP